MQINTFEGKNWIGSSSMLIRNIYRHGYGTPFEDIARENQINHALGHTQSIEWWMILNQHKNLTENEWKITQIQSKNKRYRLQTGSCVDLVLFSNFFLLSNFMWKGNPFVHKIQLSHGFCYANLINSYWEKVSDEMINETLNQNGRNAWAW